MNKQEIIDMDSKTFRIWLTKLAKEGRFKDMEIVSKIRNKKCNTQLDK